MNSDSPEPTNPSDNSAQTDPSNPYANFGREQPVPVEVLSRPPAIWRKYLAWFVIIGITAFIFYRVGQGRVELKKNTVAGKAAMMQINLVAKLMVGVPELFKRFAPDIQFPDTKDESLASVGSLGQRYGAVLLESEMVDPHSASVLLKSIDGLVKEDGYQPTENQARLRRIVGDLLEQYSREQWDSGTVKKDDREFLVDQLGWVGELGLTPVNSPNGLGRQKLMDEAVTVSIRMLCFFGGGALALLLGLVGAFVFIVKVSNNKITGLYSNQYQRGQLYLETFAIWMLLFFGLQLSMRMFGSAIPMEQPSVRIVVSLVGFFGSLTALFWPIFNGVPFSKVRRDIGWTIGNPFKEIGAGIVSYISMLPLMGISIFVAAILAGLMMWTSGGEVQTQSKFAPVGGDGHPIQEEIASGDSVAWLGVVLLACVAAPIVEETVFRGVFYRALRDTANPMMARGGSVAIACAINGFIFAAIHPQGLVGIPILMTLAIGMSLAREWRSSLIAPMTMHAINNSIVTCLMFAMF